MTREGRGGFAATDFWLEGVDGAGAGGASPLQTCDLKNSMASRILEVEFLAACTDDAKEVSPGLCYNVRIV